MKITIKMELDPDYADPDHPMGITEHGYNMINDLLSQIGTDIEVSRDE